MPSKIGVTMALPCGKWQNHVVPATAATSTLCRTIGGALRDEGSYSWAVVGVVPSLEPSHATIRSVPIVSDDGGAEGQRFSILRDEVAPKTVAMYGPSLTANSGVAANGVPLSGGAIRNSSVGPMRSSALLTEQQCRAFQRECLPATVLLPERLPPGADGRVMVAREARMTALGLTALPEYPTTPNAPRPSCLELTIVVLEDVTTGEDFLAGEVPPPPPAAATSYDFAPLTGIRSGNAQTDTPPLPMVAPLSFLTSDTSTRDVLPVSFDHTDDKINADDDDHQSQSETHSGRIRQSRRLSSTSQLSLSSAPETKQHDGGAENETIRISPDLAGDVVSGDSTPTAHAHPQNGGLLAKSGGGTGGGLARGRSRSQRRVQLMSPGSDPNHRRRATISTSPRSSGGGTPGLLNLPANNGHSRLLEPLGDVFSNSASPATSSAASPAPNAALVPLCLPHHAVSPLDARELSGRGSTTASDRPNFHASSTSPGRAGSSSASGIAPSPSAVSPSMGRRSVGSVGGGSGAGGAVQQQRRITSKASRLAPLTSTGNTNSIGKHGASSPPRVSPQHSRTASGAASSAPSMSPSASRRSSLAGTPKASNQATPKNAQRSRSRRSSRSDSRTGSSTTAPQGDARKVTSNATAPQNVIGGGCAPITDDESQSPVNSGRKLQRRASRRMSRSGSRRASSALSLSTGTEAHVTGAEIVAGSTTGAVPSAAMSTETKSKLSTAVAAGDQSLDASTLALASDSVTALPTKTRQVSVTVRVKASINAFGELPCVNATKTTSVVFDARAEVIDLCRRVGCAISSNPQDAVLPGGSWPVGSALALQGSPLRALTKTTTPKSAGGNLPLSSDVNGRPGAFDSTVFGRTVDERDPATDHHPVANAPSPYHRQTQHQIGKNSNQNLIGTRRPSVPYAMFEAGMSSGDLKEVFYPSEEEAEKRRLRAVKSEADARVRDRRVFSALDLRYATPPTTKSPKAEAHAFLSGADIRQFQHECMPDTDALMTALKAEVEALRGYHSPSATSSLSPLSTQQALTFNAETSGSESAKQSVKGSRTSKRQRDGGTGEGGPTEDPFATSLKQRSTIPIRSLPPLKRPSELSTTTSMEHCSPLHSLTAGGEAGARGGDHASAHGRPQFDPSTLYSSPKSHPAPSGPGAPPPVSPAARRLLEAQRFSFSSPSGPSAEHRAEQSHFKTQRQEESESPSKVTEPTVCFTVDVTSITDVVSGEELLAAPQ